jgi:hypothetical protein
LIIDLPTDRAAPPISFLKLSGINLDGVLVGLFDVELARKNRSPSGVGGFADGSDVVVCANPSSCRATMPSG